MPDAYVSHGWWNIASMLVKAAKGVHVKEERMPQAAVRCKRHAHTEVGQDSEEPDATHLFAGGAAASTSTVRCNAHVASESWTFAALYWLVAVVLTRNWHVET